MLKISWKDKVPNTEVLKRVGEKEQQLFRKIVQQKLAYAGHVLRGSSSSKSFIKKTIDKPQQYTEIEKQNNALKEAEEEMHW